MDFSIRKEGISELQDVLTLYLARFYKSAYRQLGNAADAEDAVQDAMLAAAGCDRNRFQLLTACQRRQRSATHN